MRFGKIGRGWRMGSIIGMYPKTTFSTLLALLMTFKACLRVLGGLHDRICSLASVARERFEKPSFCAYKNVQTFPHLRTLKKSALPPFQKLGWRAPCWQCLKNGGCTCRECNIVVSGGCWLLGPGDIGNACLLGLPRPRLYLNVPVPYIGNHPYRKNNVIQGQCNLVSVTYGL